MPTCEICSKQYDSGGDGWAGLCPACADQVSTYMDARKVNSDTAIDHVRKQQERDALVPTHGFFDLPFDTVTRELTKTHAIDLILDLAIKDVWFISMPCPDDTVRITVKLEAVNVFDELPSTKEPNKDRDYFETYRPFASHTDDNTGPRVGALLVQVGYDYARITLLKDIEDTDSNAPNIYIEHETGKFTVICHPDSGDPVASVSVDSGGNTVVSTSKFRHNDIEVKEYVGL